MDVTGNKRRYAPHPFDGTITLEGEHAVRIDEHKIRGSYGRTI